MTWRERIQAARERGGKLTHEDFMTYMDVTTCPAGEIAAQYGVTHLSGLGSRWHELWNMGTSISLAFVHSRLDSIEWTIGKMEDLALELKREGA